jgi:hypothetical protein
MRRKGGGHDMPGHAPPTRSLGVDLAPRVAAAIGNEPPKVTLVAVDNDNQPVKAHMTFRAVSLTPGG